jgi:hypothetical protein
MKRWHEEFPRTLREWKKHYRFHVEDNVNWNGGRQVGRDPYEIDCMCDEQKGRFRKKRAFGCGKSRCHICHGDKFPKREKSRQELSAEMKLSEGLFGE